MENTTERQLIKLGDDVHDLLTNISYLLQFYCFSSKKCVRIILGTCKRMIDISQRTNAGLKVGRQAAKINFLQRLALSIKTHINIMPQSDSSDQVYLRFRDEFLIRTRSQLSVSTFEWIRRHSLNVCYELTGKAIDLVFNKHLIQFAVHDSLVTALLQANIKIHQKCVTSQLSLSKQTYSQEFSPKDSLNKKSTYLRSNIKRRGIYKTSIYVEKNNSLSNSRSLAQTNGFSSSTLQSTASPSQNKFKFGYNSKKVICKPNAKSTQAKPHFSKCEINRAGKNVPVVAFQFKKVQGEVIVQKKKIDRSNWLKKRKNKNPLKYSGILRSLNDLQIIMVSK